MKRRTFIRRAGTAAVASMALSACRRRNPGPVTLRVLSWADYFDPAPLRRFEQAHTCLVDLVSFASNEELCDRLARGEKCDVLVPTSYVCQMLAKEGRTAPVAAPGAGAGSVSVPYLCGISGLAWTTRLSPEPPCSWSWIAKAERGRVTLLDDIRETMGAALKFLGHSANSTREQELRDAAALVQEWKQRLAGFESEYYKIGLVAGEYDLVHGYSGDVFQACRRNPQIRFAVPAEGALVSTDEFCIDAESSRKELAAAFIREQTAPETIALHARYTGYQPAARAKAIEFPAGIEPIDPNAFARSEEIAFLDESRELWAALWREIRKD